MTKKAACFEIEIREIKLVCKLLYKVIFKSSRCAIVILLPAVLKYNNEQATDLCLSDVLPMQFTLRLDEFTFD